MKNNNIIIIYTFLLFILTSCTENRISKPYFLTANEPTQNSVILLARINESDTLIENDIQGIASEIIFELASDTTSKLHSSGAVFASESHDYLAKYKFTGLIPGTKYYYRMKYILTANEHGITPWQSFKTLPDPDSHEEVSFVMVTGMNFHRFTTGFDQGGNKVRKGGDPRQGFPGYLAILEKKPDFFIGNGDNVYYDHPREDAAKDPAEMRPHWHRLHQMENFRKMVSEIPVIWMKDDHDYRYNDADTMTMGKNAELLLPTHEEGMKIFHEQAPFSHTLYEEALPYRSFILNEDVSIWLLEGRDFRSPNNMPDGPGKSIWGEEQKAWLKESLLDSDAKFKLLISPTPMVGPDDAYKKDNHTNPGGFRYERDQFVEWLKDNELLEAGFYVLCGDRHWQYHSLHPNGLEEFSCGALVDANSRLGREPGDPESTDPEGKIQQFYTQQTPSGGFLELTAFYEKDQAKLRFGFYDENGELLYETIKEE